MTSSRVIPLFPLTSLLVPGLVMPLHIFEPRYRQLITDIVDETGLSVGKGKGGILVIKRPWPSMIRTIWGDPERFKKSYYPEDFHGKYYLAGDGASRDLNGYFTIMGRIDDVLNVSGHRLGTMEIESALVANTALVAEAAVVGRPDDLTGEAAQRSGEAAAWAAAPRKRNLPEMLAKELETRTALRSPACQCMTASTSLKRPARTM